jgi:hypothetical protein
MAPCQACGQAVPDDQPLCADCARIIDRATDVLLEQYHYDLLGPEE